MYSLYYEFSQGDEVFQCLLIPPFEVSGHRFLPTFFYRKLSDAAPRRVWAHTSSPSYTNDDDAVADVRENAIRAVSALEGISSYMMSPLVGSWQLRGYAPIWVTETDQVALVTTGPTRLPTPIQKAITAARNTHNLPDLPGAK